jgi:hypothetical protein
MSTMIASGRSAAISAIAVDASSACPTTLAPFSSMHS